MVQEYGVQRPIDLEGLECSLRKPRSLFSYAMSFLTGAATTRCDGSAHLSAVSAA